MKKEIEFPDCWEEHNLGMGVPASPSPEAGSPERFDIDRCETGMVSLRAAWARLPSQDERGLFYTH